MFGFLGNGNQTNGQLSSSSIKEANEHMQAMLRRIRDLEQRVNEQTELMTRRDAEHAARLQNLERQKELETAALQQDMGKMKDRCRHLEGLLKERDVQIAYLFHRCSYLDEAASYVPLLDQLSQCMKSSLAAPPPKVQTVKPTRTALVPSPEFTPDVPNVPNHEKSISTPQTSNASAMLADHFARPQKQHQSQPQTQQPFHQQQQNGRPIQHDYPHYQEAVASVYAPSPNVALNHHGCKK